MGFLDFLFGSEPKIEQVSPAEVITKPLLNPEQQAALTRLLSELGGGDLSGTGTPTAGQAASLTALEQMALQGIGATAPNQEAINSLRNIINQSPADIQEYFDATVQRPALEAFAEEVLPAISRSFGSGNNFFSSERQKADATAREALLEGLATERARIAFEERARSTEQILQAIGLLPTTQAGAVEAIAAPARAISEIRAGPLQERNALVAQLLQAIGIPTQENIAFAPTYAQTGGRQGIFGNLLGAAAQVGSAFLGNPALARTLF